MQNRIRTHLFLLLAILCFVFVSCSATQEDILFTPSSVTLNVADILDAEGGESLHFSNGQDAKALDTNLKFSWKSGDTIGVFASNGTKMGATINSGANTAIANFNGAGFLDNLPDGAVLYSFFPLKKAVSAYNTSSFDVPYIGQRGDVNNSTSGLSLFDYNFAVGTASANGTGVEFDYQHIPAFLVLNFQFPAIPEGINSNNWHVTKVILNGATDDVVLYDTVNLSSQEVTPKVKGTHLVVSNNGVEVAGDGSLKIYVALGAGSLTQNFSFTIQTMEELFFTETYTGYNGGLKAGYKYSLNASSLTTTTENKVTITEKYIDGSGNVVSNSPYVVNGFSNYQTASTAAWNNRNNCPYFINPFGVMATSDHQGGRDSTVAAAEAIGEVYCSLGYNVSASYYSTADAFVNKSGSPSSVTIGNGVLNVIISDDPQENTLRNQMTVDFYRELMDAQTAGEFTLTDIFDRNPWFFINTDRRIVIMDNSRNSGDGRTRNVVLYAKALADALNAISDKYVYVKNDYLLDMTGKSDYREAVYVSIRNDEAARTAAVQANRPFYVNQYGVYVSFDAANDAVTKAAAMQAGAKIWRSKFGANGNNTGVYISLTNDCDSTLIKKLAEEDGDLFYAPAYTDSIKAYAKEPAAAKNYFTTKVGYGVLTVIPKDGDSTENDRRNQAALNYYRSLSDNQVLSLYDRNPWFFISTDKQIALVENNKDYHRFLNAKTEITNQEYREVWWFNTGIIAQNMLKATGSGFSHEYYWDLTGKTTFTDGVQVTASST